MESVGTTTTTTTTSMTMLAMMTSFHSVAVILTLVE